MSIVRTDELAAHLGVSSPPVRAQGALDAAEAFVAAYLSMRMDARGDALQEHTIVERISPVRDRTTLEVSGGPVTGIESIVYDLTGYRETGDELDDDSATETPTFEYVFDPDFKGWTVTGRNDDGTDFVFKRHQTYRVTYRTGWCAGRAAYTWQWFRDSSSDTWNNATDRLDWGFVDGAATSTNSSGGYLLGPQPTSSVEGIHYETGGSVTDERLLSPALSLDGGAFRFVTTQLRLIRASSSGYPIYRVAWKDGDGRTVFSPKKDSRGARNGLPDRVRASAVNADHSGYTTLVADMGFDPASDIDSQVQDPVRSWIDQTITAISIDLWSGGAADPNGALYLLDLVRISDGTAVLPQSVRLAILETARALTSGGGSGILAEKIGDYSRTMAPGEASMAIPPAARSLLDPYRRASW